MLERTYGDQVCSIARALEVVGERWTLLIVRDCALGVRRFECFQASLGVARNTLAARLNLLVEEEVLERRRYQERPERYEYVLTEKGRGLAPVLFHLLKWGDAHYPDPGGPPRLTLHSGCGGEVDESLECSTCGARVEASDVEFRSAKITTTDQATQRSRLRGAPSHA